MFIVPALTQELVSVEQIVEMDWHMLNIEIDFGVRWQSVILVFYPHLFEIEGEVELHALCKKKPAAY